MSALIQDLRQAFRTLAKSPGFTAVAVLSLGLGIGAGTAVFSLVNAILLRSLPVPHPHELRVLQWTGAEVRVPSHSGNATRVGNRVIASSVPHPLFLSLREQRAKQADIFGFCPFGDVVARARGDAFVSKGMVVSDNFLSALGVRPLIGRLLSPGADYAGAGMSVVITYDWWQRHFALDPGVLGQAVTLNGTSFTVVGVLPRGFTGVQPGDPSEFYVPLSADSPFLWAPIAETRNWFVRLMARLKPGISDAELQAGLDVVFAREAGALMKEPKMLVEPGRIGLGSDRNIYRKPLLLMLGVVGLVMLVACANLAGLLLARGASQRHELAVRAALGAGRWRLIRLSLTESLVLALLGGGLGILLAVWGRAVLYRLLAGSADGLSYDLSLDRMVLCFTLLTALITALLSGLFPALRAGRVDPVGGLKSRGVLGAARLGAGRFLVAAEICLSLLLLTGAGLYVRTLVNLTRIEVGFNTEKLLLFRLSPFGARYTATQATAFYDRAQASLAKIPGVRSAALLEFPLLANLYSIGTFSGFSGRPVDPPVEMQTRRLTVSETFFATMGIPILQGRGIEAADSADAPRVAVVNESFVRSYLPNRDPLGLTFSAWGSEWRIVGVCRNAKYDDIKASVQPTSYFPIKQKPTDAYFALRAALPPLAIATAARRAVAAIDPNVPLANITTQEAVRDRGISPERLSATLCGVLAGLALLLSCIGLYGLTAYHVARRTSEIAIRMALGATPQHVAGPVLREALLLAAWGVAVGVPASLALTRLIKSQLFGVQPNDPVTLVGVVAALFLVAVLAAWLPARRAAQVDPMVALRCE
jgi:predicted permease